MTKRETATINLLAYRQKQELGSLDTERLINENPDLQDLPKIKVFRVVHNIEGPYPQDVIDHIYECFPVLKAFRESGTPLAKTISGIGAICHVFEKMLAKREAKAKAENEERNN
jgi:hypothetical protein